MQKYSRRGRIVSDKRKNGQTYYSYVLTYRVKINPENTGKARGSGKSMVVTESQYLGIAEAILEKMQSGSANKIKTKAFGLPCALWKIVQEIDLINIVNKVTNKQKRKRKVSLGEYIAIAAINQVGHVASKNALAEWYEKTSLARITGISSEQLTSQHFWNAFEEIVSEKELEKKKQEEGVRESSKLLFEELERLLDDSKIEEIEEELWKIIADKFDLVLDAVLYDGTNFYTFMDETTAANIPQRGANKQKRFDKRQVGLALAVLRQWGIPIFHKIYGGQTNEQCLFPTAISRLVKLYSKISKSVEKLTIIFDQGSNSQEHIESLEDKVHFIGALSASDYPSLCSIPVSKYPGKYKNMQFCHKKMQIYGRESLVVLAFNPKHQRKQRLTFNKQIDRTQNSLNAKIKKESSGDLNVLKQEILQSLDSRKIISAKAAQYLEIKDHINGSGIRSLKVVRKKKEVTEKRLTFGKNIIFTDLVDEKPEKVLADYGSKQTVEDDFELLKDRFSVSLWPMYHWTDTKIRVHAFVSVLALLLIKLAEHKVRSHGLHIGGRALVNELQDITEALVVYNFEEAERKICEMSHNQEEIFDILGLEEFV
jgi:transposase